MKDTAAATIAEIDAENLRKSHDAFYALSLAEREALRREVYAEMIGLAPEPGSNG